MAVRALRSIALFLFGALAGACSGAPGHSPGNLGAGVSCDAAQLPACERRLAARAEDLPSRALLAAYVRARAERDPQDPWARLFGELDRGPHPAAAILAQEGVPPGAAKVSGAARVVTVAALPKPDAIAENDLLLALAGAAGYRHVIRVRPAPDGITQFFPGDPLAPFAAGLPPILRDDGALAHLEDDLAIAAATHAAFQAASAFRYIEAAREADRLTARIARRDPFSEPVLRARFALQILGNAGLTLDPEGDGDPPPAPLPDAPGPTAADSPYGDLLRVRTAKDEHKEWSIRSAKILAAISADRRDDIASLYARSRGCGEAGRPPPMEQVRDLIFANKLAGALIRDKATEARSTRPGLLPLAEWLRRYEAMVGLVSRAHVEWSFAPTLLLERGEAFGLSPAGTSTYRRVTEIGLSHLSALRELEARERVRYRSLSQLPLVVSRGVLSDDRLRDALVKLTQVTVQDKLAAAKDAPGVFGALLTGAFAGLSYPAAVQQAHFLALQGAFTAKLRGDLATARGWSAAGLYALDAAYRVITDQNPNLGFSSTRIVSALADHGVPYPALAALATAGTRYAVLAADRKLDPALTQEDRFPPERRAARDALKNALGGLGAPNEAPNNLLDDVTALADGLIATLSAAIGGAGGERDPGAPGTAAKAPAVCPSKAPVTLTPKARRALAKLGDVRQRILSHPRYKQGDGPWVRRTRLLVTLLSDAMDIAAKEDRRLTFAIPAATGEKNVEDGLREVSDRAAASALSGLYAIVRELASADRPETVFKNSGQHLRQVAFGLIAFFRGEAGATNAKGGPSMGVALLDALAKLGLDKSASGDVAAMLVSYAKAFYAANQPDQGDLWLLGSIVLSGVTRAPPSREAIELAAKQRSRVEWALRFLAEVGEARQDDVPDPAAYAEAMRKATDDACQAPNAEKNIAVMQAIHDFASGQRAAARASLDKVLEQADAEGLGVPRMIYRYEEKTATKILALSIEVSYGAGVLTGANTFQLGLGVRSRGEPEGSMTAALAPADGAKAGEEAARYYTHAAALATVYHLLEGDGERAIAAARRAITALSVGVRLGSLALRSEKPAAWGADARALLAVAAELAAEGGMPFLAGDLWTVVRQGFAADTDDKAVAAILDPRGDGKGGPDRRAPLGLAGIKEIAPILERTRRALKVVAEPLACTAERVELGAFEELGCSGYPLALSFRIADALKKLPRLKHGEGAAARCGPLRTLDGFLASAERGAYDPDAFTKAVEELRADGRVYDAAILLSRHRRDNHCNGAIVTAARSLGRSPVLGPSIRSDLLSTAINCAIAGGGPELEADILALDDDTRRLADPVRNLNLMLSLADLAVRTDQWGLLTKLTGQPEFVERWMSVYPNAAVISLLLSHALPIVNGSAVSLEKTRAAYELLCETLPPGDRAESCAAIKALRGPSREPGEPRKRAAKEAVRKLVTEATSRAAPARKGP